MVSSKMFRTERRSTMIAIVAGVALFALATAAMAGCIGAAAL
ncbi:hypothetical protein [uncultured Adlercreutzia sp.]|nr:hypothetical protein [uncultured Adlercreutzia sp.]